VVYILEAREVFHSEVRSEKGICALASDDPSGGGIAGKEEVDILVSGDEEADALESSGGRDSDHALLVSSLPNLQSTGSGLASCIGDLDLEDEVGVLDPCRVVDPLKPCFAALVCVCVQTNEEK
jgi:hypothetical protein